MNERKLRIFYEVAKTLNMTRVAEKLYVSQPSVSQVINELENELDVRLFDRIGRRIYLTEEGEVFFNYVRRILNIYDEAFKNLKEFKNFDKGKLSIGASTTIGIYMLPSIIMEFNKKYPGIEISLNIENTQNIVQLVLDNKMDFAFVEGPVYDNDIIVKKFWIDELVFITNSEHMWKNKETVNIYDIDKEKFIMREVGSGTRDIVEKEFSKNKINYNIFMELGNTEAIKKAVEAGLGISCISKRCIKNELEFGKLLYFKIDNLHIKRDLYLIHHRDKYISRLISTFINFSS